MGPIDAPPGHLNPARSRSRFQGGLPLTASEIPAERRQPGTNASRLIQRNAVGKSSRHSQDIRFVIACHSPGEFEKSDYSLGQRRKDAMKRLTVLGSPFSPVRFDTHFSRSTGIIREIRGKMRGYSLRSRLGGGARSLAPTILRVKFPANSENTGKFRG